MKSDLLKHIRKYQRDIVAEKTMDISNSSYQSLPIKRMTQVLRMLISHPFNLKFEDLSKMSMVDLGCGYGLLLNYAYYIFNEVKGVEHSERLVRYSRKMFPHLNVINGDVFKFKYNEDIIYTFNIMIKGKEKPFKEHILSKMRPGQIFIEAHNGLDFYEYGVEHNFSRVENILSDVTILQK